MRREPEDGEATHERFEYFMVRLSRSVQEPYRISGLIERLGSGEKHSFETGEQLVQLVYGGMIQGKEE